MNAHHTHAFEEGKCYCTICGGATSSPAMIYPCPGDAHEPENAAEALEALIKLVDSER